MPKCIGILTSGGDAPGMNAAIRAVTRSAIFNGIAVKGIYRGYRGLVTNEIVEFKTQNVSNIIQVGGTILKTARCMEFRTEEGRKIAYDNMVNAGIDSLVVIGGDGSLTGARIFATEYNIPVVGLPGTIDNDLYGTDTTIGYDTALNTIMQCVDKIRDRSCHNPGNLHRGRPVGGTHQQRFPQEQELFNRACCRKPCDGRRNGSCRTREKRISAI